MSLRDIVSNETDISEHIFQQDTLQERIEPKLTPPFPVVE